jgi:hypothetical protein
MKLPQARYDDQRTKRYLINFKGYNNNPVVEEGELVSMKNLSSSFSPCLSPREPREVIETLTSPTDLFAKEKLCKVDGTDFIYDGVVKGAVLAGEKSFVSMGDNVLILPDKKYYNIVDDTFGSLENTYTSGANQITFATNKITTSGADFSGFVVGDGVTISGCLVNTVNNKTVIIREIAAKVLTFSDETFTAGAETAAITVKRAVPDIDFACEYNNRCWGGKGNDVYASKQGDPKNWNVFDGLVTDSWATDVGSDGDFTGCVSFAKQVFLFKENYITKVFGDKPSNFRAIESPILGIQSGCAKSAAVVNEILFYKSISGIMALAGGSPSLISQNFGDKKYSLAVGGADDRKYYVSLYDGAVWTLFVYDTWNGGNWHIEDDFHAIAFAFLNNSLYAINAADKRLYKFNSGVEAVEYEAVTEEFTEVVNEKKGHSQIGLRADLEIGSTLSVYVKVDNGEWQLLRTFDTPQKRTFAVAVRPERADMFQIKLVGVGKCKVYALVREFFYGSEV